MALLPEVLSRGYHHFRSTINADERARYIKLAEEGQKPKVMVVACCDARAAPETIFDAKLGELFVMRNVANLIPPYAPDGKNHATSAALEFAIVSLDVQHVVIMGHARCGGIAAAIHPDASPLTKGDFIGKWMSEVREVMADLNLPEHSECHEFQSEVERISIEHSLDNLRTFPWMLARENAGQVTIHGVWFDISTSELYVYDEASHRWEKA